MKSTLSKKIALLHYSAPSVIGGVESVLAHHAQLMTAAGHQVRIIAGKGMVQNQAIEFVHLPLVDSSHPRVLAAKSQLDQGQIPPDFDLLITAIEESLRPALTDIDIVIAHNVCSLHKNLALTAALRRVCAAAEAPHLILWHHDLAWTSARYREELYDGWPWNLIGQDWTEIQPRHVVVSEWRRQELSTLFNLSPANIAVVPSGLDIAAFFKLDPVTVELADRLALETAGPILLLPVRITQRKNIELAIRVLATLRQTFPQGILIVTGPPGPHNPANQTYFARLKSLQAELGLATAPAVFFLTEIVKGYLPDSVISDLYRLADILILPSREEGFGIPVLEAGLAGLPIFCADIAPLREIAGDMATYFSPDIDPTVLARQIADWLQSNDIYQLRQHIRHYYTWDNIYGKRVAPLLEVENE